MKLLKEPLFHFLVLGTCLFVFYQWIGNGYQESVPDEIVVTSGRIENLANLFEKTWQRSPSQTELEELIQNHVREEVLYREALALGLDRDDPIVRRRLRQKIEFLSDDLMALEEPSEEVLKTFLVEHPDSFRQEARLSFRHIYLNPEKRGTALNDDVRSLLAHLRSIPEEDFSQLGDSLMIKQRYQDESENEILKVFGPRFLSPLLEAPIQTWFGPVPSGYGLHMVFIEARTDSRAPSLDEVHDAVVREWSAVRRKETSEAFYHELLKRYTVTIEKPPQDPSNERLQFAMVEGVE